MEIINALHKGQFLHRINDSHYRVNLDHVTLPNMFSKGHSFNEMTKPKRSDAVDIRREGDDLYIGGGGAR